MLRRIVNTGAFLPITATGLDAYHRFAATPDLAGLAVLDGHRRPLGLVDRTVLLTRMALQWGHAVYANRPVSFLMDPHPLVFAAEAGAHEVAAVLAGVHGTPVKSGFILVDTDGQFVGTADGHGLVRALLQERDADAARLGKLNAELDDLVARWSEPDITLVKAGAEALDAVMATLGVGRCSLWLADPGARKLVCQRAVSARLGLVPTAAPIPFDAIPIYLDHILSTRAVDAHHCWVDPRTLELTGGFLSEKTVMSVLDARVRAADRFVGLISCEALTTPRLWRPEEVGFVASIADLLGQVALTESLRQERNGLEERVKERTAELEAATAVAQAANQAKSRFIANMSHELRTPLNAIVGYTELMRETAVEFGRDDDIADHDKVLAAARNLLSQISSLLDLSRIEANRTERTVSTLSLRAVLQEAQDLVAPMAARNGNTVVYAVAPDADLIRSDRDKVLQCLLNLLSNACKFTRNGQIVVTANRFGPAVAIAVRDTGIGVPAHLREEIFKPFSQGEEGLSKSYSGTGLGLAIVRSHAAALGGTVQCDSTPGQGSVFTLTIAAQLTATAEHCAAA